MTQARFKILDGVFEAKISGHAGFNPGNDPLCAAQSILAMTLAQCMLVEKEQGTFDPEQGGAWEYSVEPKDGFFYMKVTPVPDAMYRVEDAFMFAATGLALMAGKYPQFIQTKVFVESEDIGPETVSHNVH